MLLRPKHLKAIEILAGSNLTLDEAARAVGVSRRTISRWLANKAFKAELARVRPALSYSFEGLRARTAKLLLMDVVRRLETDREKLPIKEVTALLAQLMGEQADAAAEPPDGASRPAEPPDSLLGHCTPEQIDEIWNKVDEVLTRGQKNPDPTPTLPFPLGETEGPCPP